MRRTYAPTSLTWCLPNPIPYQKMVSILTRSRPHLIFVICFLTKMFSLNCVNYLHLVGDVQWALKALLNQKSERISSKIELQPNLSNIQDFLASPFSRYWQSGEKVGFMQCCPHPHPYPYPTP